jgi:Rha family phage regulatory protein
MKTTPVSIASPVLIELIDGQPTTTSLDVASHFGKLHKTVLRAITNLDCSPEFTQRNFAPSEYTDSTGRKLTQYRLTRDGFTFLCMGFTGKEAAKWKEAYINAFSQMEAALKREPSATSARQQARQVPLLPASRNIRSRDDLSFTKRDAEGRMLNWFMPSRENNWHEHYGIGEIWFSEIVELARHNPEEAYRAMYFAGPELTRYWSHGHPNGFFDRMARWAMAAILANPTEPQLPFDLPCCGIPPREGMDFHLAAAPAVSAPDACRARRYRQAGVAEGCRMPFFLNKGGQDR